MLSKEFKCGDLMVARRMWAELLTSNEIVDCSMRLKGHVYKDDEWQEIKLTRVRRFGSGINDFIGYKDEVISLGHGTLVISFRTRLGTID